MENFPPRLTHIGRRIRVNSTQNMQRTALRAFLFRDAYICTATQVRCWSSRTANSAIRDASHGPSIHIAFPWLIPIHIYLPIFLTVPPLVVVAGIDMHPGEASNCTTCWNNTPCYFVIKRCHTNHKSQLHYIQCSHVMFIRWIAHITCTFLLCRSLLNLVTANYAIHLMINKSMPPQSFIIPGPTK